MTERFTTERISRGKHAIVDNEAGGVFTPRRYELSLAADVESLAALLNDLENRKKPDADPEPLDFSDEEHF